MNRRTCSVARRQAVRCKYFAIRACGAPSLVEEILAAVRFFDIRDDTREQVLPKLTLLCALCVIGRNAQLFELGCVTCLVRSQFLAHGTQRVFGGRWICGWGLALLLDEGLEIERGKSAMTTWSTITE